MERLDDPFIDDRDFRDVSQAADSEYRDLLREDYIGADEHAREELLQLGVGRVVA